MKIDDSIMIVYEQSMICSILACTLGTRKLTKFSTGTKLIDGKSDPAVEITTSNGFFSG